MDQVRSGLILASIAALTTLACKDVTPAPVDRPSALPRALPTYTPELGRRAEGVFQRACSHCHGARGDGDGPAGKACRPAPANFRDSQGIPTMSDGEIFARITHGKAGTCMPSFRSSLSVGDRLALVLHLRRLVKAP